MRATLWQLAGRHHPSPEEKGGGPVRIYCDSGPDVSDSGQKIEKPTLNLSSRARACGGDDLVCLFRILRLPVNPEI